MVKIKEMKGMNNEKRRKRVLITDTYLYIKIRRDEKR